MTQAPSITTTTLTSRGAVQQARTRTWLSDLSLALYCASIVIGAGILTLPRLTASIGLLPALALTVCLGMGMAAIYARLVCALYDYLAASIRSECRPGAIAVAESDLQRLTGWLVAERTRVHGIGVLDELYVRSGAGRPGRFALLVGLTAYVVPAAIGYVSIGGKTLSAVAALLAHDGHSAVGPVVIGLFIGIACVVLQAAPHSGGRAALVSILQMVASWAACIAILMTLPGWSALPVLLFAVTTGAVLVRTGVARSTGAIRGGLEPEHRVGVVIAVAELSVLFATGFGAVLILAPHDGVGVPEPIAAPSLQLADLSTAVGVLLFAFTGTGLFNLLSYPRLVGSEGSRGRVAYVVTLGTLVPAAAYVWWMLSVACTVSPEALVEAERSLSYPTIQLAENVAQFGAGSWPIVAGGYFVALLAVTGAAAGFSESLGDRFACVWRAQRGHITSVTPPATTVRRMQLLVLACATIVAGTLAILPPVLPFSSLLAVAGNAGGGLLLLVLPFMLPTGGRRRPRGRDVAAATSIAVLLVTMNLGSLPAGLGLDPTATVTGAIMLAIDAAFIGAFAWLAGSFADHNLIKRKQV